MKKTVYLHTLILATLGLYSLNITNTYATTLFPVERVCPIGGEKYKSFEIGSTSSFGMRLDLRRIGPASSLPWVECPNGFVVFKNEKDFSKAEIAKLTPIVASSEFQNIRKEHTTAYRVVYLRRHLGENDAALAWLILQAAWEAEDLAKEVLRQEYLTEAYNAFISQIKTQTTHNEKWWSESILIAEIERQRHHFDESIALLDKLPVSALAVADIKLKVIAQIRELATKEDATPADFKRK